MFLYYKVVTLQLVVIFSFPHSILWKWVTKSNPHSRGGQSSSTSWKGNSLHITWNYSVRKICSFSPHFQIYQSFIYSCMNSILKKIFWVIIQTVVILLLILLQRCSQGALSGWLLCLFDMPPFWGRYTSFLALQDIPGSSCIFFCLGHRISFFSKELWFLLSENDI